MREERQEGALPSAEKNIICLNLCPRAYYDKTIHPKSNDILSTYVAQTFPVTREIL